MLQVELVTPERRVLKSEADEVTLTGTLGQLTVLPGHIPLFDRARARPYDLEVRRRRGDLRGIAGGVA